MTNKKQKNISKGWQEKNLGDICSVNQGLQIPIADRFKEYEIGRKKYITNQFLAGKSEIEYIEDFTQSVVCNDDDILMTRTGNTGVVVSGVSGVFHNNFFKIKENKKIINNRYFIYFLKMPHTQHRLTHLAGSSTIPDLNHSDFFSIKIILPPLPEQKQIVKILETWDKCLEKLSRKIEVKKNIKKGLMQRLLTGVVRLSGFSGEWESVKLGVLADVVSGGTPSTDNKNYWNGDILWITPSEITKLKNKYIKKTIRHITKLGLKKSSAKMIPPMSLILCSRATVGDCAINLDKITTNQGFKNIIPNSNINVDFLYYLMITKKDYLKRISSGSTFLEFSKKDLEKMKLIIPSNLKEQNAIANILTTADKEIEVLEKKKKIIEDQKKYLLNNLVTGKIRILRKVVAQ